MQLEKQVVSIELSKRLRELGVKQESLFEWQAYAENDGVDAVWGLYYPKCENDWRYAEDIYAAYTVAELGELLPYKQNDYTINQTKQDIGDGLQWAVGYMEYDMWSGGVAFEDTEADARAKMLIYLIENKLITV